MIDTPQEQGDSEDKPKETVTKVIALPMFVFYQRTYANSCGKNDSKAVKLFKEFENTEKVRKLRVEMLAVSQERVEELVCDRIIGKGRKSKFETYQRWAKMMIAALQQK